MRYFEDFQAGDKFDLGTYPPLTESEIIEFARQWDAQPFHVDPVAAKDSMFGGLVASGWHTGAIAMKLFVAGMLDQTAGQGSPGLERMRFVRPVRPGDELSGTYEILETAPSGSRPGLGKLRTMIQLRNQSGEVVLEIESWTFVSRRTPA